jgi:hypothetical protein
VKRGTVALSKSITEKEDENAISHEQRAPTTVQFYPCMISSAAEDLSRSPFLSSEPSLEVS